MINVNDLNSFDRYTNDDMLENMRRQTMNRLFAAKRSRLRGKKKKEKHIENSTQLYSRVKDSMNIYAFMCAQFFQ